MSFPDTGLSLINDLISDEWIPDTGYSGEPEELLRHFRTFESYHHLEHKLNNYSLNTHSENLRGAQWQGGYTNPNYNSSSNGCQQPQATPPSPCLSDGYFEYNPNASKTPVQSSCNRKSSKPTTYRSSNSSCNRNGYSQSTRSNCNSNSNNVSQSRYRTSNGSTRSSCGTSVSSAPRVYTQCKGGSSRNNVNRYPSQSRRGYSMSNFERLNIRSKGDSDEIPSVYVGPVVAKGCNDPMSPPPVKDPACPPAGCYIPCKPVCPPPCIPCPPECPDQTLPPTPETSFPELKSPDTPDPPTPPPVCPPCKPCPPRCLPVYCPPPCPPCPPTPVVSDPPYNPCVDNGLNTLNVDHIHIDTGLSSDKSMIVLTVHAIKDGVPLTTQAHLHADVTGALRDHVTDQIENNMTVEDKHAILAKNNIEHTGGIQTDDLITLHHMQIYSLTALVAMIDAGWIDNNTINLPHVNDGTNNFEYVPLYPYLAYSSIVLSGYHGTLTGPLSQLVRTADPTCWLKYTNMSGNTSIDEKIANIQSFVNYITSVSQRHTTALAKCCGCAQPPVDATPPVVCPPPPCPPPMMYLPVCPKPCPPPVCPPVCPTTPEVNV